MSIPGRKTRITAPRGCAPLLFALGTFGLLVGGGRVVMGPRAPAGREGQVGEVGDLEEPEAPIERELTAEQEAARHEFAAKLRSPIELMSDPFPEHPVASTLLATATVVYLCTRTDLPAGIDVQFDSARSVRAEQFLVEATGGLRDRWWWTPCVVASETFGEPVERPDMENRASARATEPGAVDASPAAP